MRKKTEKLLQRAGMKLRLLYALGFGLAMTLACSPAFAAGGKPATKLVNVADTRALPPGFAKWVADLYNTNLWLYGLVVVVIMAGMGAALGLTFDKLIGLVGIDLGKLDHHE